jgi:NADH-ubiquinone oxidoreductase chain 5
MLIFYLLLIVLMFLSMPSLVVSYSITQSCQLVFSLDYNSLLFSKVLIIISISVLLWSYSYLDSEPVYIRFFSLILRFLFSIFILIFATSLLSLFIGWDLLGFTSFFLVAFYGNQNSHMAAMLTGLSNRVGDCFFFLLIALCLAGGFSLTEYSFVLILLVGITKSAQLPFSSWLPAAMFAPTPVRALVHSSTLVTAGIYLLYRFGPLHSESLLWIGVITSLAGGIAASLECDIKKVIAYSTLSQLGILMSGLGLGLRTLTYYHLLSHAVIKALIFISIGMLIHSYYGSQEARSCTRLYYASGLTTIALALRAIGLAGVTFTTGYYSKEPLLESGYLRGVSFPALIVLYLSFALTLRYLLRLGVVLTSVGVGTTSSVAGVGSSPVLLLSSGILIVTMLLQAL